MLEPRLVDLELRFMKLERFTQELSDVVAGQAKEIDALTKELQRVRDRLSKDDAELHPDERPPHY
jgi:SlyX protein